MIALKACPRCHGDLVLEAFLGESELVCLQCGYRRQPKAVEPTPTTHVAGRAT